MDVLKAGIDCDETVFNFMYHLNSFLRANGLPFVPREQQRTFDLWDLWGCSRDEAFRRVELFYESGEIKELTPRSGAVEAFERLFPPHRATIVTSRPKYMVKATKHIFAKHLPGRVDKIYHTDQYTKHLVAEDVKVTKGTIAKALGLDMFVEDALHHAEEIASHGIPVYLLNCPWNESKPTSPLITRGEWKDFPAFVESYKYAKYQER